MAQPITIPKVRPVGAIVGGMALVLAVVLFVFGAVSVAREAGSMVDDHPRVPASGGTVDFDEAGRFRVFAEYPGADDDESGWRPLPIVTSIEGRPVEVRRAGHNETYRSGGHAGVLVGEVVIAAPGRYRVVGAGEPGDADDLVFAFGDPVALGSFLAGGLSILAGIVLGIFGIVLLVVGGLRHARRRRLAGPWPTPVAPPVKPSWTSTPPVPASPGLGSAGPVMLDSRLPPPPSPPPPADPSAPTDGLTSPSAPPPLPEAEPGPPPLPGRDDPPRSSW